jgi:mlo protein
MQSFSVFEKIINFMYQWGIKERSCFMKNHVMISSRLISGVLVQFWCSYGTVPLNVIVTQMGSRHKKAVIAESVRDSLHSWCKRVKERSKHTRSVCSLDTATIDERDEMTVGTLSRSSSMTSLNQITINSIDQAESIFGAAASSSSPQDGYTSRVEEYLSETYNNIGSIPPLNDEIEIEIEGEEDNGGRGSGSDENNGDAGETLLELFRRT